MKKGNRIVTTIYIDKIIDEHRKKHNINISDWVRDKYIEDFFSIRSKSQKLQENIAESERLKDEIIALRNKCKRLLDSFDVKERTNIKSCVANKEKFNTIGLYKRFFQNRLSFDEFVMLLDYVESLQ